MRCVVLAIAMLGLIAASGEAQGAGTIDEVALPSEATQSQMLDSESGEPRFERADCVAEDALCRSQCARGAERRVCVADRCAAHLAQCLASLPVGRSPSLPLTCMLADRSAVQQLERQGELLDMDPTLFAESYHALIRARIACRAGLLSAALDHYGEIRESLEVKLVPGKAGEGGSLARKRE